MATILSYTTIEQSKVLAEILPLESADMAYFFMKDSGLLVNPLPFVLDGTEEREDGMFTYLNCWSLAALLDVLRIFTTPAAFSVKVSTPSLIKTENGYKLTYIGDYTPMINNGLSIEVPIESVADNAIECCVNMIIHLHEHKML